MLKVMLVEDEDIVRDDIKELINWENYGFEIIAEARNGGEGLRIFMEHNPDIIITDIKMPVMGGLEMISNILKIQKNKKFILLTAYGDFDFAREAIKLGINSYVLKHELDGSLLIQELNKLKRQMEEEKNMDYFARMEIIRRLIGGTRSQTVDEEIKNLADLFHWQGRTGIFMLKFDHMHSEHEPLYRKDTEVDKQKFADFLYTKVFMETDAELVDLNENEYVIFLRIPESCSERKDYEYTCAFASRLQVYISKAFNRTISIAIGPTFENYHDIKECFKKTKEIFSLRVFKRGNCILTNIQQLRTMEGQQDFVEGKIDEIRKYLMNREYIQVKSCLDVLFTDLLIAFQNPVMLRNCIFELFHMISLIETGKQGANKSKSLEKLSEIGQLENVFQISEWFKAVIDNFQKQSGSKYSKKVTEILQFIHENYQKDITLNEIADRLGISFVYASQLFKKEIGVSFVAYLTKYRINKAQELLESGKYKVYEVGSMVGYHTVQYFCRTFKKITGKNPGDY